MRRSLAILLLSVIGHAADAPTAPVVAPDPFEPPAEYFFQAKDKFVHPPEIVAPRFLFPFEFRRGGGAVTPAEVVILVQLDGHGRAKTLKVFASRYEPFTRSAIEALEKAQWDCAYESWFYYKHVYTLDDIKVRQKS